MGRGRAIRVASYLAKMALAHIVAPLVRIANPALRNVWILSERGTDARDNGYFFYRFMTERHPEQRVFYVIDGTSVDAKRIDSSHRVEPGSFRHYLIFALSTTRISTHAWGGDLPVADYYRKLGLQRYSKHKFVFLQHGITKDCQPSLSWPNLQPDLFICGAEPEYEYVRKNFGHPEGVVRHTGFARFDSLSDAKTTRQILVMPTFRKYLQGMNEDAFASEQYYKTWQAFLDSPRLAALLDSHGLELVFYPHYEMQRYVNLFHRGSQQIEIADFDHYDVQTLLKESALLITDFSSVFFDFAYMRKPVLFYQFDRQRYIVEHYDYTKGYFDYDTMAPGKVVFESEDLVDEIATIIESAFDVERQYADRRDSFFTLDGSHNCDRIYEAIEGVLHV